MSRFLAAILLLSTGILMQAPAQTTGWVGTVYGGYVTKSELFLYPNSPEPTLRNNAFDIEDIFLPGITVKYELDRDIYAGLSIEYIEKTERGRNVTVLIDNKTNTLAVDDGFRVIPLELSIFYRMPFSTESFSFFMGGGIGYYFGSHIRQIGSVSASTISREAAYGLHVFLSMEYHIFEKTGLSLGMKFRDPKIDMISEYDAISGTINNKEFSLGRKRFPSGVNINGAAFQLGINYHF